jgi:ABC-type Fe3+-hydroxamate transport system substrate-binding protein
MQTRRGHLGLKALICLALALSPIGFLHILSTPALAIKKYNSGCETVNAIFISDKIAGIAYRLGVVPVAYCARCCWPMVQKELSTVKRLGCYRCASVESVLKTAEEHKVKLVLVEPGCPSIFRKGWDWNKKFGEPLKEKGYNVQLIDFSKGVPRAIIDIGKALGKEEKARKLADDYTEHLKNVRSKIHTPGKNKKILILKGSGRRGIQVEAPGGYTDRFLLEPLGCVNVGNVLKGDNTQVKIGHFNLESWQAVARVNPDIIVKCGNPYPVERGLARALKKYPELSEVTAIKKHAVYTLPAYIDSSVTQYPRVLSTWIDAICR